MSRTLLCIEPDATTAMEIRRVLAPFGFVVENIADGDEAIEWGHNNRPELIVLSVEPRKVGYAICNKLKRSPSLREVPVVLVSSEETMATFEQHKKLKTRADEYMLKPIDVAELRQKVDGLIGLGAKQKADEMDLQELDADADIVIADDEDTYRTGETLARDAERSNVELEARIESLETERQTLRRELEEARERFMQAAAYSKEREFLGLREIINKKEKDILNLRDAMDAKEREILDYRDKVRELDRGRRDLEEKTLGFEKSLVAANEKVAELTLESQKWSKGGDASQKKEPEALTASESAHLHPLAVATREASLEIQRLQSELAQAQVVRDQLNAKDELLRELCADPDLDSAVSREGADAHSTLEVQLRQGPDGVRVRCGQDWTPGYPLSLTEAVQRRLRSGSASHADVESIGEQLFAALQASPEFAASYREQLSKATERLPLRIVLVMLPDVDDPARISVADHPWEALRDRENERHLGVALDVRLIRTSEALQTLPSSERRKTLKVVVGFSSPVATEQGEPLPTLSLMNELQAFREVESLVSTSSRIALQVANRVGLDNFADFVSGASLLHFSGHGVPGRLMLQSEGSRAQLLDVTAFCDTLSKPLPLVITLNCCRSAGADERGRPLPVTFLRRGVPVVVAMTGDLADATALRFAREFYTRVFAGEDMETALQKARWRLFAERSREDWFLPSLWTTLDAAFAPAVVDGTPATVSDVQIRRQIQVLNAEVAVLRPRLAVLERLDRVSISQGLRNSDRDVLVDVLTREVGSQAGSIDERIESAFADSTQIDDLARRLSTEGHSEAAADRLITSMQQSIVPQLAELVGLLPKVLEGTIDSQGGESPNDGQTVLEASGEPLEDHSLALPDGGDCDTLEKCVERVLEELALPARVIQRAIVNLLSGRHLVLIGPPGTGKSRIAQRLTQVLGYESMLVTANPDWTTFDVIGGMVPVAQRDRKGKVQVSYAVRPGCIVEAVRRNWEVTAAPARWQRAGRRGSKGTWLIIDEVNRAPMDHSFGDLFTALLTRELRVPRVATGLDSTTTTTMPIPLDFRLLCTANTADRHLLFQMSEALKRRFVFIEVPAYFSDDRRIPNEFVDRITGQLAKRPELVALRLPDLDERLRSCISAINPIIGRIRAVHPLGTAQVVDAVVNGVVASKYAPSERAPVLALEALVEQVVPALESLPRETLLLVASLLDGTLPHYLRRIAWQSRSMGDDLPGSMRSMIVDLAGYLEGVAPDQWGQAIAALRNASTNGAGLADVESVLPADPGTMASLAAAGPLASALRRIAGSS